MNLRKISFRIAGIEELNWSGIPKNKEFWYSENLIEILDKIHRVLTAPKELEITENLGYLANMIRDKKDEMQGKAESTHLDSGIFESKPKKLRQIASQ